MSSVVKTRFHEFPRPAERGPFPAPSQFFFNRELSLLEFHARVLEEALDDRNPLLERLKFLAIFSSNLDEFFMIRVSGLKEEMADTNVVSPDGLTPFEQLAKSRERVVGLIQEQARCLREEILPQLKDAGLALIPYDSLSRHERESLKDYFMEKVFPILTPLAVDPSHPFPYIAPLSLNIGLMVEPPASSGLGFGSRNLKPHFVRIKVPSILPRLVPVGLSG